MLTFRIAGFSEEQFFHLGLSRPLSSVNMTFQKVMEDPLHEKLSIRQKKYQKE